MRDQSRGNERTDFVTGDDDEVDWYEAEGNP